MKPIYSSLIKVTILFIFVSGLVMISRKIYGTNANLDRTSFIMISNHFEVKDGRATPILRVATTAVNFQTRRFRIATYTPATGKTQVAGGNAIAHFRVNDNALQFVGASTHINEFNENSLREEFFRASPLFVRESEVAGIKVFVFRNEDTNYWQEDYWSTRTGFFVLKRVRFDKRTNIQYIEEAVNVQFRPLTPSEFEPPDLPISFEDEEKRIASFRSSGTPAGLRRAEQLEGEVERVKQLLKKSSN